MGARILIAGFKHETNTFSTLPTDLAAYRARAYHTGAAVPEAYGGTRTEIAAFMDACADNGWTPVYGPVADATPSGPLTRETYETIAGEILDALESGGRIDGLLLQLHGAMVAEHTQDGEGTLLARIRERIGRDIPIAATLDLHANVTDAMAEHADILVSYRTYPHVDMYEVAARAAGLLARTLAGEIRPRTVVRRGRMLDGADHGRTTAPGPMTEVLARADAFEAEPGVLAISVNAGFPWADIHDTGPTALVVGDREAPRYGAIAEALIAEIWDSRRRKTIETLTVAQAMARLAAAGSGDRPVVLADFADNPGGGGYGDSTHLLGGLIAADARNAAFGTLYDPDAAAACHAAGEGAEIDLEIGGKIDPRFGAPLDVRGTVVRLHEAPFRLDGPMAAGMLVDMGKSALLRVGGVEIVLASARYQAYDQQYFKQLGVEPAAKAVLAVKSAHHFRAAFGPIAREIIVVDAGGGLTSHNLTELPYKNVRRPVFPLDLD